jgi:hypothetical protein
MINKPVRVASPLFITNYTASDGGGMEFTITILAVVLTLAAWFVGFWIDANLIEGFFMSRFVLPVITMGVFILEAIKRKKY